jgi:hypothetical protein
MVGGGAGDPRFGEAAIKNLKYGASHPRSFWFMREEIWRDMLRAAQRDIAVLPFDEE